MADLKYKDKTGKSISKLRPVHIARAGNYPEAFKPAIGLLNHSGRISLEFKRLEDPEVKFASFPENHLILPNQGSDK